DVAELLGHRRPACVADGTGVVADRLLDVLGDLARLAAQAERGVRQPRLTRVLGRAARQALVLRKLHSRIVGAPRWSVGRHPRLCGQASEPRYTPAARRAPRWASRSSRSSSGASAPGASPSALAISQSANHTFLGKSGPCRWVPIVCPRLAPSSPLRRSLPWPFNPRPSALSRGLRRVRPPWFSKPASTWPLPAGVPTAGSSAERVQGRTERGIGDPVGSSSRTSIATLPISRGPARRTVCTSSSPTPRISSSPSVYEWPSS